MHTGRGSMLRHLMVSTRLAPKLLSALCVMSAAAMASTTYAAIQDVSSIYQTDFSGGSASGWSGTYMVTNQDRRGTNTGINALVAGTSFSSPPAATAASPAFSGVGGDGSFRLTFNVAFEGAGRYSSNYFSMKIFNSATGNYWQLQMLQKALPSSGLVLTSNTGTLTGNSAAFDWGTGAANGVGAYAKVIVDRDGATNQMNVYATFDLNAAIGDLTPLITLDNTTDIAGLNQVSVIEPGNNNLHAISSIQVAAPVPEAASLGLLAFAGGLAMIRRR